MAELRFDAGRLDKLMKKRDVSDGKLAELTGISKSTIYYLRKGKHKSTSAEKLKAIAEAPKTTEDYFLGEEAADSRVPVRLPELIRQLAEIASNLSEIRQAELIRIAEALRKLEEEQQTLTTPMTAALIELGEKLKEQGVTGDAIKLLESLLPPPRRLSGPPRRQRLQGLDKPS